MKKNYIKPSTATFAVKTQSLLQNSVNMGGSKGTYNSETMTQASRQGGGLWDDEEE